MSTVYEVMIPFCPCGAGGCQDREMAVGPSTSPDEFKGGDDGTITGMKILYQIYSNAIVMFLNQPSSGVCTENRVLYGPWPTTVAAEIKKL